MNQSQQFIEQSRKTVAHTLRMGWCRMPEQPAAPPLTTRQRILQREGTFTADDISLEGTTRTGVLLSLSSLEESRMVRKVAKTLGQHGFPVVVYEVTDRGEKSRQS